MSIKNQFFILAATIIIVPILCVVSVLSFNYIKSSDRILMEGYKEIRKLDETQFTQNDWDVLLATIKDLPLDVDAVLLSEDNTVILSSISEFTVHKQVSPREMWELVNGESEKYFYQVTSPSLQNQKVTLITRTLRDRKNKDITKKAWTVFFILFITFGIICIILIIFISTTIFKSIILLENKTEQIANGDLSTKVTSEETNQKTNEITNILNSLEKMRISLIEAQNKKNKFIMGISHDLRTPVAVIKGYTEAIRDGIITEPEEIKASLELIGAKTNQFESMIETLISFMKLNTSEIRQNLIPCSITEIIQNFAKESKIMANVFKRNIILDINLPSEIIIPLDQQLANRAFQNLFSNAIRYTKDGDEIHIISYLEKDKIFLKIKDTGIGMEEKDKEHIFDLFYRATSSRREEGMGIGLSVVKSIIETHGWDINVESEFGKGTTFTIIIPVKNQ